MTAKELAQQLDGTELGSEVTSDIRTAAKDAGLVVVYGASDDLMEFDGAIYDEIDGYGGGNAYIDHEGVWEADCSKNRRRIRAIWCPPSGGSWTYKTDIPHETFRVYEDGELYCTGIVFAMEDV